MPKEEVLNEIFSDLLEKYPELENMIIYAKEFYIEDKRNIDEIKNEIDLLTKKYELMETMVNKDINEDIASKSILLIGPMGVGKSTVANKLSEKTNLERLSLDAEDILSDIYDNRDKFDNFKDFEFYLTVTVLTNINKPYIIDFGAGHSIYENPLMFLEFKKLMSKFSNVVLLMPSENKEESLEIINERISKRNIERYQFDDNRHFIESPCNYEVATITEYTNNKNVDEISDEILKQIEEKQKYGL